MHARTCSHIAKNLEVRYIKHSNAFRFTFEDNTVDVPKLPTVIHAQKQIDHIAHEACLRLFKADVVGAILNERLKGVSFD